MAKRKTTRKCAVAASKKVKVSDPALKANRIIKKRKLKKESDPSQISSKFKRNISEMFLNYNTNLGPPYNVILDTNYINFSLKNHLDLHESIMACLNGKCNLYITDCVMSELEKMGERFRVAVKLARDERITRLRCQHKGTYADDCIVKRVDENRCYLVATCDKELKGRIRKIVGVPILSIKGHSVDVEMLPEAICL